MTSAAPELLREVGLPQELDRAHREPERDRGGEDHADGDGAAISDRAVAKTMRIRRAALCPASWRCAA